MHFILDLYGKCLHELTETFNFFAFSGEFHLGYPRTELQGASWYHLLHWDCMREAQSKHRLSKYLIPLHYI
jgi:hypothetical protein